MKISARSSAKLQCRGKKPTSSTNHQHLLSKKYYHVLPINSPINSFFIPDSSPAPVAAIPSPPSTAPVVRIALPYSPRCRPRCRPSNHVPTLPHTDPVCSPVASRVSSPLLQRREASHWPCVRGLRYRVLGACGVRGDTHDLEARTHSCERPHAGPQCV
jgi:hypothetical protein